MASVRSEDNHTIRDEHKAFTVSAALRTGSEMAMTILVAQGPCDSEGEDGEILETEW